MSQTGAAADVFEPVLRKLQANAAVHFGSSTVRLAPTEMRERPFSYLLRVAVQDAGGSAGTHLFVKVYKPKEVEGLEGGLSRRVLRDFEVTRHVYESMRTVDDLGAVRPVACYPEDLAIVTEEAEGATLLDILQERAAWTPGRPQMEALTGTLATVGRWIRAFQSTLPAGSRVTIDELKDYLDVRLRRMVASAPRFTGARRTAILRHVERLAARVPPGELAAVPVHSDMSLGNILVSGRRVIVLDFAMSRSGTKLHDLSRLALQLDLLAVKPHFRNRTVLELQQALMEGFDPHLTADAPLFRLHVLLHRVNHLLTLTLRQASVPEALYNRIVCRRHDRWITRELAAAVR